MKDEIANFCTKYDIDYILINLERYNNNSITDFEKYYIEPYNSLIKKIKKPNSYLINEKTNLVNLSEKLFVYGCENEK